MRPVYRQHGEERTLIGLLLTLGVAFVIGGLLIWRYPAGTLYISVTGEPVSILGVPMARGSVWASASRSRWRRAPALLRRSRPSGGASGR